MATVMTGFGRTGAMLILEPRERLIYPFNIGDYSEVRFGMFFSWTTAASDNANPGNDLGYGSAALSRFYWGFSNYNTGTLNFPTQNNGYDFVGMMGVSEGGPGAGLAFDSSAGVYRLQGGGSSFNQSSRIVTTDQTGGNTFISYFQSYNNIVSWTGVSVLEPAFVSSFYMRLRFPTNTGFIYNLASGPSITPPSLTMLRSGVNTLFGTSPTDYVGYFTSGSNATAPRMMSPNAILLYNPMLNSRLRIHGFLVDRYA